METSCIKTHLGLRELARHRPRSALGHFATALESCSGRKSGEVVRVLFYLGVTMRKLGMENPALRSWIACQKLSKRGFGSKMVGRFANVYGMQRQESQGQDDWQAFRSVQVKRYLGNRGGRFGSPVEAGLVTKLIRDRWTWLCDHNDLSVLNAARKCALFRSLTVDYPWSISTQSSSVIPVSFSSQKRVSFEDRCPCGSGRPFRTCCGRTVGVDEIVVGML